ncbi:hypothetical protein [Tenacibaculum sp. 190524A05c]|uniref:hypothetical protein n=1 Tax=Tenacibaculum platacis TaxID=3137852 RepID=UPI0031FB209A
MNSRLIKISSNKIYLTNEFFIELSQTNFPEGSISFKYHIDTYLKVEVLNYDGYNKIIELRIHDYSPEDFDSFKNQKLKKPIDRLIFRELEWSKLKKLLSHYTNSLPDKIPDAFKKENLEKEFFENSNEMADQMNLTQNKDKENIYEFSLQVPFSEAQFHDGYVSIFEELPFLEEPFEFKIMNDLIRSEFYFIRNYFKIKDLLISVKLIVKEGKVLSSHCESKEIANIDEKVISTVKNKRVLDFTKIETNHKEEGVSFTVDGMFFKLNKSSNTFEQTEFEVLKTLIKIKSPRNAKQLIYLAGDKHDKTKKIRFTLKPIFGFIFFISGKDNNHICWELLDSHATYIWSFEKVLSIEDQIEEAELNINTVRKLGRKEYRKAIKNNEMEINSAFSIINHSKLKEENSFEVWRNKFESKIA